MVDIVPPRERVCTRCGRQEHWDERRATWVADGDQGTPHCLHEWNINGSYTPVAE